MCLAVPMQLLKIKGDVGIVELGGVQRDISLMIVPEAKVGDYLIVHAGTAIQILDEEDALETMKIFEEMEAKGLTP
ncbi:MAG: HypC/HybG/HupF family hydrogenase formation chaperone [Nitrospinota bacterium]|nr:HypC/HybG/HupF family hydrogenase formation chaperone [Nitrospinota bacterium]